MSLTLPFLHLKLKELKCREEWLCLHVLTWGHTSSDVCAADCLLRTDQRGCHTLLWAKVPPTAFCSCQVCGSTGNKNPEINGCL